MASIKSMVLSLFLVFSMSVFADPQDPNYVTVEQIEASLAGTSPMAVGFDVDDTVIFSAPVFYYMVTTYCDGVYEGCSTNTKDFWKITNKLDAFSLPKNIGLSLVQMHLDRGDTVYFITARTGSKGETLSTTLRNMLNAPYLADVVFAGYSPDINYKVSYIKELDVQIYYGDADSDMSAAFDPGNPIRGIRILRAPNSLYMTPPNPGMFNEEVVIGSEY